MGEPELGCGERVVLESPVKGSLSSGRRGRRGTLEAVLDLTQLKIGDDRDAPLGPERFQPLVDPANERVDARDHAVQHRLNTVDQAVRRLKHQIANGCGEHSPDRLVRLVGSLKRVRGRIAEGHDAFDGALHPGGSIGLEVEKHHRGRSARRSSPHLDPIPDFDREILQERHRLTKSASSRHKAGELVDKLARANDQRPDAGPDQGATQQDQRRGEPTDRQRCGCHTGDPTPCKKSHKRGGIGGQTADVVEKASDRDAEWPGAAGHGRHGIRDRFQRGCRSDRQLVRQPAPDEAKTRDRVVGPLDLVGILLRHDDAEGQNILCRLAQCCGVDPRHRDGAFLAEQLARHGGAFCGGHEAFDGGVDRPHPLIQRQRDQVCCRQPKPVQRVGSRSRPGGRLAEPSSQILCRLLDARHGNTGQLTRALKGLDRGNCRAKRLRKLRLRIDGLQSRADHGHACSSGCGDRSCSGNPDPSGERRKPSVGRFHLAAEPSEPARPSLADTFQLGAHLSAAHRSKADRNALLSHWNDPPVR